MNNFVFSQDPLLYTSTILPQQPHSEADIKRQLDTVMAQYQAIQQQKAPQKPPEIMHDYLGELDNITANLDQSISEALNNNEEFITLNNYIKQSIQIELMKGVKERINSNPEVVNRINRMKEIINEAKSIQENEDRRSLNELNDYIKNYSDMTFNEYKQLKSQMV